MNKKKIYIVRGSVECAAALDSKQSVFKIENNNRAFRIKRVYFDYVMRNKAIVPLINNVVPEAQMTKQQIRCFIGVPSATPMGLPVIPLSGVVFQDYISIYKKGQYTYDNLVIANDIQIIVGFSNYNLTDAMVMSFQLVIEIEDYE